MDQARWLIVLSVVICMTTTLAILKHIYPQPELKQPTYSSVEADIPQHVGSTSSLKKAGKMLAPGAESKLEVKFSAPPSHIFAMDSASDYKNEAKNMRTKGKILE